MIWPPLKAWTCQLSINGQIHFVAIDYGGKNSERWVIMMSVLDSSVILKVPWSRLCDPSNWQCGWDENNFSFSTRQIDYKNEIETINCSYPSLDSGLTIPITKDSIRPWFRGI